METVTTNGTARTLTINTSVMSVEDFGICPSNCNNYTSPYISGLIVFNNTRSAARSIEVFVNGNLSGNPTPPQGVPKNIAVQFKGTSPVQILPIHKYTISVIVTFYDNSMYTASEVVTSNQSS